MRPSLAQTIAVALGGHSAGNCWMARCPAHDDSTPSLSIKETRDGKLLVHCHAGCEQTTIIAVLQDRGLWAPGSANIEHRHDARSDRTLNRDDDRMRTANALQLWCAGRPADETLVQIYLRSRGIRIALPGNIKFHSGLKHRTGSTWPAMIGLVTRGRDNQPIGVHRTYLARDGRGKAPIEPNKMMLGPCRGGAVRLAPAGNPLMIGEGIETCLAAMQATGHGAWSSLSTSGLRTLDLPPVVQDIIVLADGDAPGEAAALAAAARLRHEGRRVRIARPPQGADFNDVLLDRSTSSGERPR
ncbi:MAG: toprim domain-containing protein [Hyphomicrobiaceae bacterium]|nr:toprim domain-containing protein [Hyphomicrobiaceae bacterium]